MEIKRLSNNYGRRKDFFPGGHSGIFLKFFQWGAKSSEILFFPLKTKKTTFFAKDFKI